MSVKERVLDQEKAAEQRFRERASERKAKIDLIRKGPAGLAQADDPERVEKRLRRLRSYYGAEPVPKVETVARRRARRFVRDGDEPAAEIVEEGRILEKIIGTQDYVDVRYFEGGVVAARAVCKINIGDGRRVTGWGTGSLVGPRLLLTNHHVLPDRDSAANSQAEFNFQDMLDGSTATSKQVQLDPDTLFIADQQLDFALVAVRAGESALAEFGFNRLIEAEGKAIIGEFVTIIQHPRGQKKQVALRENRIVDIPELFLHYAADTEPGSSGSPVFNDQWEIVGLHHASQKVDKAKEKSGFLNEGIRISRILRFLGQPGIQLSAEGRALLDQLRVEGAIAMPAVSPGTAGTAPGGGIDVQADAADGQLTVTIPIEVSVRVPGLNGPQAPAATSPAIANGAPPAVTPPPVVEKIEIDPDYKNRRGYDRDFLAKRVPLPTLTARLKPKAAKRNDVSGAQSHVLTYHHYSVVMNGERGLAFFTAVNIDGKRTPDPPMTRGDDAEDWAIDPRIKESEQTLEPVYKGEPFDRGHLVRRLDSVWGKDRDEQRKANDDTFHYTNAAPQHKNLNRKTWLSLEKHILDNADIEDLKVSVFTGPVFADSDQTFQGTRIPRQFWKVVAMVKRSGDLSVTGYLLSQEDLIKDLDFAPEEFVFGEFKTFQVPVKQVAKMTGLSFGSLPKSDPLERVEAAEAGPRPIDSPQDLIL